MWEIPKEQDAKVGSAGGTDICRGIDGYLLSRRARVLWEKRW